MPSEQVNFDEILHKVGAFGFYQKYILFLVALPCVISCWQCFLHAFVGFIPHHRCWIDGFDNSSTQYIEEGLNKYIPFRDQNGLLVPDPCRHYISHNARPTVAGVIRLLLTSEKSDALLFDGDVIVANNDNETEGCTQWKFDSSEFDSTIATEWQLFCHDQWKVAMAGSINMAGGIVGFLTIGIISDRYGRRTGILTCLLLISVCGIAAALVANLVAFMAFRFVVEAVESSLYHVLLIFAMEFIGQEKRVTAAQAVHVVYSLGEMSLAGLALVIRRWRALQLVTSAPALVLLVFYYRLVPESARWLLTQGQKKKAFAVIRQMARWNRASQNIISYNSFKSYGSTTDENCSFLNSSTDSANDKIPTKRSVKQTFGALGSGRLLFRTIIITLIRFLNGVVYMGITLSATALSSSSVMAFFWTGLVEIPANISCIFIIDRFGRRFSLGISFWLTAVPLFALIFMPKYTGLAWVPVVLGCMVKFGCTFTSAVVWIFSAELFPTELRASGIGLTALVATAASILAPVLTVVGRTQASYPFIIFCGCSMLGGALAFLLPDTSKEKLPDTLEEADNLGHQTQIGEEIML